MGDSDARVIVEVRDLLRELVRQGESTHPRHTVRDDPLQVTFSDAVLTSGRNRTTGGTRHDPERASDRQPERWYLVERLEARPPSPLRETPPSRDRTQHATATRRETSPRRDRAQPVTATRPRDTSPRRDRAQHTTANRQMSTQSTGTLSLQERMTRLDARMAALGVPISQLSTTRSRQPLDASPVGAAASSPHHTITTLEVEEEGPTAAATSLADQSVAAGAHLLAAGEGEQDRYMAETHYVPWPRITFCADTPDNLVCQICLVTRLAVMHGQTKLGSRPDLESFKDMPPDSMPAIMPCGHVAGAACLQRAFDAHYEQIVARYDMDISSEDPAEWREFRARLTYPCPFCRVPCVYPGCHHAVLPRIVTTLSAPSLPPTAAEGGVIPDLCPACEYHNVRRAERRRLAFATEHYKKKRRDAEQDASLVKLLALSEAKAQLNAQLLVSAGYGEPRPADEW